MIKNNNDIGFIHDIGSLDRLRQQAVNGEEGSEKKHSQQLQNSLNRFLRRCCLSRCVMQTLVSSQIC